MNRIKLKSTSVTYCRPLGQSQWYAKITAQVEIDGQPCGVRECRAPLDIVAVSTPVEVVQLDRKMRKMLIEKIKEELPHG